MLISYRWLSRHVDLTGIDPKQLALDLTLSTAEVESVEPWAPHMSDVTVGHVLERVQHPDADKLGVCQVDLGTGEPVQIVCGASNVGAGQRVAVATVGTVLPGDFKIKKSKIRGVASNGMICSVRELDLGDEHDGIWVLPGEPEVGTPVAEALDMTDWVIEIDNKSITHRPDLWGHRGIAGEVAAIYERELKPLDLSLPATGSGSGTPVRVDSPDCSRYVALEIDGARPLASPSWLQNLLLAVGQRPIDQIVDVSNFVMLDLAQPNHVFDRTQLASEGIRVRNARAGESMTTLDGEERKLIPADLLICSGDEPVALAGIMGGEASKVTGDTQNLLLEIATFQPAVVRRTSSRLGLRTDSSARFEKSLDPTLTLKAAAHFVRTLGGLQELALPSAPTESGDWQDPAHELVLRPERVRRFLGADLEDAAIAKILERIGFGVTSDGDVLRVAVPSARATKDVTIEQDLIEEVGRIHRYGSIPEAVMVAQVVPPERNARRLLVRKVQDRLAGGARFHEVMSYSFIEDDLVARLGLADEPYTKVINPVAEGTSRIRRSVTPSLLGKVYANRRQRSDVRLFEIGKGYRPEQPTEKGEPAEVHELCLVHAGPPPGKKAAFDAARFHHLRGVVDDLFEHLALEAHEWRVLEEAPAWAHPVRRLGAFFRGQDQPAALLSDLDPGLSRDLGLVEELVSEVAVAEVSLDRVLEAPERGSHYRPIPRFPGVKIDVAVSLAIDTPQAEVVAAIEQAGKGLVAQTELFDLYSGPNLGEGKKSLAYHVVLQSPTKTLSDKETAKFLGRLERVLEGSGAELRKG